MHSFCLAVQTALSSTSTPSERGEALNFLEKYQNSLEAWNTSIDILSTPIAYNSDVIFFASQTLKHKMQSSFSQLNVQQITSIQEILFSLLFGPSGEALSPRHNQQLVLAFGALLLQCPIEMGPQNIIPLLLSKLTLQDSNLGGCRSSNSFLLLSILPEQLDNTLIPLSSSIKERFITRVLDPSVDQIITILISSLKDKSEVTCLLAWMRYGKINFSILVESNLLPLLFQRLFERKDDGDGDGDGDDIVSLLGEAICECFYKIFRALDFVDGYEEGGHGGGDADADVDGETEFKKTGNNVLPDHFLTSMQGIFQMLSPLLTVGGVRRAASGVDDDDNVYDNQYLRTLVQVFVEGGESLLSSIIRNNNISLLRDFLGNAIVIAQITRERTAFNYDLLSCSFMFWEALEDVMFNDLRGCGEDGHDERYNLIQGAIMEVYKELTYHHLSYPLVDDFPSLEERDSFRDFRHVIGDCLRSLNRIIGSSTSLDLLLSMPLDGGWQQLEALLFAIRVIDIDRREEEMMPPLLEKIFSTITSINEQPILLKSFMVLLGNLSEWISCHSSTFLSLAFNAISLVLLGDGDASLLLAASHALKMLSLDCGSESLWGTADSQRRCIFRNIYEKRCNPSLSTIKDYLDCSMNCCESISILINEESEFNLYLQGWIIALNDQNDQISICSLSVISVWVDGASRKAFISGFIKNILNYFLQNHHLGRSVEWIKESLNLSTTFLTSLPMERSLECIPLILQYLSSIIQSYNSCNLLIKESIFDLLNRGLQSDHSASIFSTPLDGLVIPLLSNSPLPWNTTLLFISLISHPVQQSIIMDENIMKIFLSFLHMTIEDPSSSTDDYIDSLTFLTLYNGRVPFSTFDRIPSTIHLIHEKILQGFSTKCLRQICNYLRSLYLSDPCRSIEIFSLLLESLPRHLFTDQECQLWLREYKASQVSYNARNLREFINSFIQSCKRRF